MAVHVSVKRLQIDKANTQIVVAVGIAAFALTFSLIAARSLIMKQSYQNKVVSERKKALTQLDENIAAVDELKIKYADFVNRQENVIKGNSSGNGERDGDNARIVLDALPSKYDFPALASSLEKILVDRNYGILGIGGEDDEAAQNPTGEDDDDDDSSSSSSSSDDDDEESDSVGNSVEMPFQLGASGEYRKMIDLLQVFGYSIRPMKILTVTMNAEEGSNVNLVITGTSYYQPERTLNITEEVVK